MKLNDYSRLWEIAVGSVTSIPLFYIGLECHHHSYSFSATLGGLLQDPRFWEK